MTQQRGRRVVETGLTLGAVLGSLCLVVTLLSAVWGIRPLVFRSGSMSPAITTGALAFARPVDAADLQVGDVVSVPTGDTQVTHRIAAIDREGDLSLLTLKGDANPVVDPEPYRVTSADRVFFAVPFAGRVLAWLSGSAGLLLGGTIAAALLWVLLRPGPRPPGRRVAGRATVTVALLLAGGLAASQSVGSRGLTPTWATWTDQASVTGSASAHSVTSQTAPTCIEVNGVLGLGDVARLRWSHVHALYQYAWELRTTGGTVRVNGVVPAGAQAAGTTVTLDVSPNLVSNGDYNVVVRARLAATPAWMATTATTTQVHRTSILGLAASMKCGH